MSSSDRSSGALPPGTWRLGRIGRTDVLARPSLLVMGVVLVLVVAPRFDGGTVDPYVLALTFVVGLYVSVFLHELAHLALARLHGMHAPHITLHLLGGETVIEGESRSPWQELSTSIVGPIASALLGLLAWAGAALAGDGIVGAVLWSLGWVNLLVALFNLVPGLPLDGGRVLRAVVWGVTGKEALGVRVAAWVGRLTAVAVVAWVLLLRDRLGTSWYVDLALALLVGAVLWRGATDALQQADRLARVNRLYLDRLAAPLDPAADVPAGLPTLPAGLHGSGLLRAMSVHPATTYLVVDRDGRATGLLHAAAVDDAYRRKP